MDSLWKTIDATLSDLSFWIGLIVVTVFAIERFGRWDADIEELDLNIPARSFTTRFRYNFAALAYSGIYSALYIGLIFLSAFPQLQDILKHWLGEIGANIEDQASIATPLGAAMVSTTVLPSVPYVRHLDVYIRSVLREFASIPLKARYIATILVRQIAVEIHGKPILAPHNTDSLENEIRERLAVYDSLRAKSRALQQLPRLRSTRKYTAFFAKYRSISDALEESTSGIRRELRSTPDGSSVMLRQIDTNINRLSIYIACALLAVEPDEYTVLKTISEDLRISGVTRNVWRFKSTQIGLGIFVVGVFAIIGSILAAFSMRLLSVETPPGILEYFIPICILVSVGLIPVFVIPLIFAAGAEMYNIDRAAFGERQEWDERLFGIVLTFIGCLGSALLVALILGVIAAGLYDVTIAVGPLLPWGLPPAAVALTFFLMSYTRIGDSRWLNVGVDFGVHAGVAVAAAMVAQNLLPWTGLEYQRDVHLDFLIYAITEPLPIAIMAGLVGGTLGALQCAISRGTVATVAATDLPP